MDIKGSIPRFAWICPKFLGGAWRNGIANATGDAAEILHQLRSIYMVNLVNNGFLAVSTTAGLLPKAVMLQRTSWNFRTRAILVRPWRYSHHTDGKPIRNELISRCNFSSSFATNYMIHRWGVVDGPPKRDASLIFIGPKNYPSPRKYIYIYIYVDYVKKDIRKISTKKKAWNMKHAIVWYSHPQKFIFFEASATFSQRSPRFFPRGLCRGSPHGVPVLTEEGSQGWPNRLHHAQVGAGHPPPPQADWQPAAFLRIRWKSQPPKKHVFRKRLHPWRGVDSMHGNGIDNIYIYTSTVCVLEEILVECSWSSIFRIFSNTWKKKRSPLLQQKNSLCNEGKVNNEDALESICKDLKRYTPEV